MSLSLFIGLFLAFAAGMLTSGVAFELLGFSIRRSDGRGISMAGSGMICSGRDTLIVRRAQSRILLTISCSICGTCEKRTFDSAEGSASSSKFTMPFTCLCGTTLPRKWRISAETLSNGIPTLLFREGVSASLSKSN